MKRRKKEKKKKYGRSNASRFLLRAIKHPRRLWKVWCIELGRASHMQISWERKKGGRSPLARSLGFDATTGSRGLRGGDTRSSIPVHTRRNASTREENAGLSSTLDTLRPYTCRKELSKISNPTNLVGELPSRWCTPSVRISLRPAGNLFLLYVRRIYIRDSSHHG